jgi:hypothetical protein
MWILLMIGGCSLPLFPDDDTRENIPLAEARSLAPFGICLPSYLPEGVELSPQVVYHAEGGSPDESDVRLRYYFSEDHELAIEVFQKYAPGRLANPDLDEADALEAHRRELLAWVVGWPEVDKTMSTITTNTTIYEDDKLKHGLFEIIEPVSLRANMMVWAKRPVGYAVYTRLSTEEAKQIAKSITDCMIKPTATP